MTSRLAPFAAGALLLLPGLACKRPAPPEAPPRNALRVPLPQGWSATAEGTGLAVGPQGRPVGALEPSADPLPPASVIEQALSQAHAQALEPLAADGFVGFTYDVANDAGLTARGFVGVRQVGRGTVRCASTELAALTDLAPLAALCRAVSLADGGVAAP